MSRPALPLIAAHVLAGTDASLEALPRHPHTLTAETVRASQAARILIGLAEVVAAKGYATVTVADVVAAAGVSRKTFYELYADKEHAFLAAYAGVDLVIDRMTAAALQHDDPRSMLRAGVETYLQILAAEPAFGRMLVIDAVGAGPRILARRAEAFDRFVDVLAVPVQRARRSDRRVPAPSRLVLLALLGGINELCLRNLLRGEAAALPALAPVVMQLLETVLLPDTSGRPKSRQR